MKNKKWYLRCQFEDNNNLFEPCQEESDICAVFEDCIIEGEDAEENLVVKYVKLLAKSCPQSLAKAVAELSGVSIDRLLPPQDIEPLAGENEMRSNKNSSDCRCKLPHDGNLVGTYEEDNDFHCCCNDGMKCHGKTCSASVPSDKCYKVPVKGQKWYVCKDAKVDKAVCDKCIICVACIFSQAQSGGRTSRAQLARIAATSSAQTG